MCCTYSTMKHRIRSVKQKEQQLARILANIEATIMMEPKPEGDWDGRIPRAALDATNKELAPFGWYDHFNDCLYRNEADAKQAEEGGNKITPLYAKA